LIKKVPPPSAPRGVSPLQPYTLHLQAPKERRRPSRRADAVVHLGEASAPGLRLHHNLRQFWPLPDDRQENVQAFLLAALGVWAADKLALRVLQPDAWTRQFRLDIPASPAWARVVPELAPLVNFLTGDDWTIQPREAQINLELAGTWPHPWQPTAVALFSGGLDSLTGAIDLLEQGHRLILASHYDYGQLAATQQSLAVGLKEHYGSDRLHHLALRVQLEGPELTLRSRSLLYLALGLTAAAAFPGRVPLFIPENGWIALNPPLTLNRLGAYSTRTTHPHFLEGLAALWRQAGISQELVNPYQHLTKGEMLAQCRNLSILGNLAPLSVSCARPVAGRWQKAPGGACGYCYPCLVRRAALHRLGWDRGRDYRVDVLAGGEVLRHRVQGGNLRALCLALKTWEDNPQEVLGRLSWERSPAGLSRQMARTRHLLNAGFGELARWLGERGSEEIKGYLGGSIEWLAEGNFL
jgi:7-cyano-7-deazaguanine synthase in queuosine biosynthesis